MRHPMRSTRPILAGAQLSAFALGLGLMLSACSNPDTHPLETAGVPPTSVSLEHTLDVMLRPSSQAAAETFLAALPTALATHDETVANPHDPRRQDTVRTLQYDGLALTVYRVQSTGTRFPVAVSVTSPAYRTKSGLHVGLSSHEVVALLGEPTARHGGTWVYQVDAASSAPFELTVRLDGGTVRSLRWAAYLD